ncbi:MAG: ATP-binding protein [Verrucomicrobiales bacterium]|nr:ATP-binding protein [Verrucomicrobiales bacterium]
MTEDSSIQSAPIARRRVTWSILALFFLLIVGLGSWVGLRQIEQRVRENVGSSLSVMVATIHDSLRAWYRGEQQFAERMARNPEVVRATRELLAASSNSDTLLQQPAFRQLREFFATRESSSGNLGIFLISPDEMSLFSMRDVNVGQRNIIAEQKPELFRKALAGESILIPPIHSDIALDPVSGREGYQGATMFVATPVKSPDGKIMAILTVRLDPAEDFSRIFQTGRLGASGESYAVDKEGWLLSESRFDEELISIGLMREGDQSLLGVRVADPGRRLTQNKPADSDAAELPLTLMASKATRGKSGMSSEGYRDYRGELVLGALKWDPVLNIGITSEIDEAEALIVFRATRNIVATILTLTVALAFVLAVYLVKLDERKEAAERLRKEKSEVESAANAKSEFLAHMSHEIRTPLNAIIGFSQLLRRDESLSEDKRRTVRTIERSGNHLLTLINDILEMSKIEAGQLTLNLESVSLRGIAEDMRDMMGLKAQHKGLRFEMIWDDALPEFVDIDSGKFRQIVLNLLSNAVKFTESGIVRLIFSAEQDSEIGSGEFFRVEVKDSGPGISEDDQEKLFGAFYQSDAGRRQQGGTGLGLAISAKFANYLGGDLTLASELGKGSTFTLRLPLEASSNLEAQAVAAINSGEALPGLDIIGLDLAEGEDPPRILIAEDQVANRELMESLLGEVGFCLRFAENGREVVEMVDEWRPDFVWMDLMMPEMNGDEATRLIREKHGSELPIVALTASVLTVDRDALLEAGFSEILMKPLNPTEVFGAMADFLKLRYLLKTGEEGVKSANNASSFDRLVDLPDAVKEKFQGCIDLGDLDGIGACVEEIRSIDPTLADALAEPLANFAFGSIAAAMKNSE